MTRADRQFRRAKSRNDLFKALNELEQRLTSLEALVGVLLQTYETLLKTIQPEAFTQTETFTQTESGIYKPR